MSDPGARSHPAGSATAPPVAPLRHLGRFRLVAVGINSVIGGGIFIMPAEVAGLIGPASIAAYVLAGLVVTGVGLALASLASRYETSGGPYLYVRSAFGEFAGFQVGWLFCLARLTAMANLVNGFARYLGALLPWAAHPVGRAAVIAACAALIMTINMIGIRQTSGAANLFAFAKVVPLVILGIGGLFFLHAENFTLTPVEPLSFLRSVLLLIFVFSGFEILTVPAEESLQPRRDMPFAVIATVLAVCGIYLMVHTVATGMLPGLASEQAPLATAAGMMAGPAGRYAMTLIAATSMAGCALISLVGGTRLLYAMSRARQVPWWMGSLHAAWRTPVKATLLMGGIGTGLAIASAYSTLAAISAGTRLLVYLACCLACLRGAGGRIIPVLTSLAIVALLCALKKEEIMWGLSGIIIGTVLYFGMMRYTGARRGRAVEAVGGMK
ncbi:MAG: APC family permease [Acidobacteriota bacterium]